MPAMQAPRYARYTEVMRSPASQLLQLIAPCCLQRDPGVDPILIAHRHRILQHQIRSVLLRACSQAPFPLRFRLGQLIGREYFGSRRHLQLRVRVAPLCIRQVMHRKQPITAQDLPVHLDGQ